MRIVAWNIRAGGGRRVEGIFAQVCVWQPEVVVLSEFRQTAPSLWLAQQLALAGWGHQRLPLNRVDPRQNGVFIASRYPLRRHQLTHAPQEPARWLLVWVEGPVRWLLAAMHVPNQFTGRKPAFHEAVLHLAQRFAGAPAVFVGDTNSGQIELDEQAPVFNQRTHDWFDQLQAVGWVDAFRHQHGARREYTWFSPNRGNGFRLDQAFVSPVWAPQLRHVRHEWGRLPPYPSRREALSDHAALIVELAS